MIFIECNIGVLLFAISIEMKLKKQNPISHFEKQGFL